MGPYFFGSIRVSFELHVMGLLTVCSKIGSWNMKRGEFVLVDS